MEKHLLKLLGTKEQWRKYDGIIDKYLLSEEGKEIYKALSKYYEETQTEEVQWGTFATWFAVAHPMYRPEKQAIYASIITGLGSLTEGEEEQSILDRLNRQYYCHKIAELAVRGAEGDDGALEAIELAHNEYRATKTDLIAPNKYVVQLDIHALLGYAKGEAGLNWRLQELNLSCGPLRKGDLALIGSRVHNGKTTFLTSESSHMATQLTGDQCIAFFENEEAGERIKLRLVQAVLGCKLDFIERDPDNAFKLYLDALGGVDRFLVYDRPTMSMGDVEKFLDKTKEPALIVFDQLHKVKGFDSEDNSAFKLGKLFGRAKEWAKTYAPILTSHQADGTAHGVLYPEGNQLAGCRTDIQAELDLQIMMGKSLEMGREVVRGLNIVKNRLLGGPDTKPEFRHSKWEVTLQGEIARFKSHL